MATHCSWRENRGGQGAFTLDVTDEGKAGRDAGACLAEALSCADRAVERAPGNHDCLLVRGRVREARGDRAAAARPDPGTAYRAAADDYDAVLRAEKDHVAARFRRGRTLRCLAEATRHAAGGAREEIDRAIADLEEVVRADPEEHEHWEQLAPALKLRADWSLGNRSRDYERGAEAFERALRLDSRCASGWGTAGLLQKNWGGGCTRPGRIRAPASRLPLPSWAGASASRTTPKRGWTGAAPTARGGVRSSVRATRSPSWRRRSPTSPSSSRRSPRTLARCADARRPGSRLRTI